MGSTDADGAGWTADERTAPGLAAGGGDGDSSGGGAVLVLALAAGHQPDSAAITARIKATMVSRIPARSLPAAAAAAPGMALAPSAVSLTG